jgi:6-phosphogluconolactonase
VTQPINVEVLDTAESVAKRAAGVIAEEARKSVAARGRFVIAVSGGHTPWIMLRELANEDVPWPAIQIVQVDERVAPAGDPDRNLTHLRESLLDHAPLSAGQIHAMRSMPQPCRRYSTLSIWDWGLTATPLRLCQAIQC